MSKKPWFKFYCSDYLLDEKVTRLPLEAQAILIRIWCIIWLHGCIPSDPDEISRRIGVPTNEIQKHLQNLLQILDKDVDGTLYSSRMDEEMEKYERISVIRTAAVKSRYSKVVTTNVGTKPSTKEPTNGSTKALRSESESDIKSSPEGEMTLHGKIAKYIQLSYERKEKLKCPWDASEAKLLKGMILGNPSWKFEDFRRMVDNRYASDGVNGERPRVWLSGLSKYNSSPLDTYNRPKITSKPQATPKSASEQVQARLEGR